MPDQSVLKKRIAEAKAKAEAEKQEQQEKQEQDSDLVPEVITYGHDGVDLKEKVRSNIDILDAYDRWCGKPRPKNRSGQREGIQISCPIPGHVDSNPSAWINLDKQQWFCGACQVGGDIFDIAAYWLGIPDYKEGSNFPELCEKMLRSFGYTVEREVSGNVTVSVATSEPEEEEASNIISIVEDSLDDFDDIELPNLDWRPLCPPDTFLAAYMKATSQDTRPEEYHFFNALFAIGLALGRNVTLVDEDPVFGNIFVCALGASGAGKSRAQRYLKKLLAEALPNVKRVGAPASPEHLIKRFMDPIVDPVNPRKILGYDKVCGYVEFSELDSFLGRASRQGNGHFKPTLQQFYDADYIVDTGSNSGGILAAEGAFASVFTTSQPRSLAKQVTSHDASTGFLNRWLFITGKDKTPKGISRTVIDITPAIKPLQDIRGYAGHTKLIDWAPTSEEMFEMNFQKLILPIKRKDDLHSRVDLTMKKLVLLFAANRHEDVISEQSVQDALYCLDYIDETYGVVQGQLGNTVANEMREDIIKAMVSHYKKTSRGASMRDLKRSLASKIKSKKYDETQLYKVLEYLIKWKEVEVEVPVSKVGRPTERYIYVG